MPNIIRRIINYLNEPSPFLRPIIRAEEAEKEVTYIRSEIADLLENTKKELEEYERENAQEGRNFNREPPTWRLKTDLRVGP